MEKTNKIGFYLDIGRRRKWYIIIPLVLSILISFGVYKVLPKIYKATTLILVQPQQVPENYVRSTVTASVTSWLNTISQEILSRTTLEKVIQDLNLYPEVKNKLPMEEIVGKMRKAIEVNVQSSRDDRAQNTFSVSFEGEEPGMVTDVANKLASLFIEENLKVRALQAERTSEFLSRELTATEEKLIRKEQSLREFRERHMGELPQQLEANLRTLERLQQQLKTVSEGIRAAEDRSVFVQNQIDQIKRWEGIRPPIGGQGLASADGYLREESVPEDPIIAQWKLLNRELRSLRAKYTDRHPEVIELERKIAELEPSAMELLKKREGDRAKKEMRLKEAGAESEGASREKSPLTDPVTERLILQYGEQRMGAMLEAKRLREEEKKLNQEIALYQKRIEITPKREQEMLLLSRDYDLLKINYQSLMDKKLQSQMAENLELKQQGEQFKVLDPARVPEKPMKPNLERILQFGVIIGLVLGLGLAWFRETMDQSFYTVEELEDYLELPVLVEVPNLTQSGKMIIERH